MSVEYMCSIPQFGRAPSILPLVRFVRDTVDPLAGPGRRLVKEYVHAEAASRHREHVGRCWSPGAKS